MSNSTETEAPARDYRATLFLPATDFPMKAGLPEAEPKWLARWAAMDLYGKLRRQSSGKKLFVLHDGPPYANGEIHSGTGLNKILKDFVVRSQTMLGRDAPYVPGWDCHGLPIEWKIEEKYRSEGKKKDDVPIVQLRKDCREFASHWIDIQRAQFKRLGVQGLWEKPYTTMDFRAEAIIAAELHKFVENGLLYRGFRPVMWSPVEKTALAEAEVEYHDKQSPTIYVKFPVRDLNAKVYHPAVKFKDGSDKFDDGPVQQVIAKETALVEDWGHIFNANVVIWTTTPWTIPGNRAVAFSPDISYGEYEVLDPLENKSVVAGEKLILADALAAQVESSSKIVLKRGIDVPPELLGRIVCSHPFRGRGYDFDVPVLPAEFVTADTGTGFVHIAPGHGEDDFELGRTHRIEVPQTVGEDGSFLEQVPLFAGKRVLTPEGKDGDANGAVIKELINACKLLAKGSLRHSYPHSWRSKAPVIFRATPQWFVAMDKNAAGANETLRTRAMAAIESTQFYPAAGRNRIGSMVEGRPDWVLSRQRAWGVPIAIFVNKKTGEILNDPTVFARIKDAFVKEGADAWYTRPAKDFLGDTYDEADFEQVRDILDVWFDSGSTHAFVLENPLYADWPRIDRSKDATVLYLEGSDQHRGWFQSSLLESCGTRGRAPYDKVLTHGFVLDEQGRKMSKSLGNTVLPQVIADKNGADILRLWAASSDFTEDLRIGQDIIKSNVDSYRRLRNTIRFMLANLSGFEESERIEAAKMPELERYMLARLAELDQVVRGAYDEFDFNKVYSTLFAFCTNDLSAFYFDIRKDALYCDPKSAVRRRAARTVTDEAFRRIVTWFAPILCFTMEEAWTLRFPGEDESVHLQTFPETPAGWANPSLVEKWARIRTLRRVVTGALEVARRDKVIGASLEAAPVLYVADAKDKALFESVDLAEIAITSAARVEVAKGEGAFRLDEVADAGATFHAATGEKCARCWMILPEVGKNPKHDDLCNRCAEAVDG